MLDDKLVQFLSAFPKNKSIIQYNEIMNNVDSFVVNNDEFESILHELERKKLIEGFIQNGYSITDEGLYKINSNDKGRDYVIRKLMENNGIFNFLHLEGRRFKNETERFAIIQELKDYGYIKKLDSAIGQTHTLTPKFHTEQLSYFKRIVLAKINEMPDEEVSWDNLVIDLGLPTRYQNDLLKILEWEGYIRTSTSTKQGNLIRKGHRMAFYIIESLNQSQSLNTNGNSIEKEQIFFSYAWREGEKIVDDLYNSLKADEEKEGYKVVRDKEDLEYTQSISEFIKQIGKGNYVIVAFSDKYLRSPFCMYELYELFRNSKLEKQVLMKKVFPIRVENINLNDPDIITRYLNYWRLEEQKWEKLITNYISSIGNEQKVNHERIRNISHNAGSLLSILSDINALNTTRLISNDFDIIKKTIKKRILNKN